VLLAELIVRHTRRHMPTRRVALDGAYLPTSGPAHGVALLNSVMAANVTAIDDDERALLARVIEDARKGLTIPRIAMRHRLQHDVHGLDRSRHRIVGEEGHIVVEIDVHGSPGPQILGAVMGAASLPSSPRAIALDGLRNVVNGRWRGLAAETEVRYVIDGDWNRVRPPLASADAWTPGEPAEEARWRGIAADERWAMEVLGLGASMTVDRDDVNRRFRRLLRAAHPDSGGATASAAARIAELTEARTILLASTSEGIAAGS
jgi:hypothetical protein